MLLCFLVITGCDKIKALTGDSAADPKVLDAQSIGYACRVSRKLPETCMKENDSQSPTFLLNGWKSADKDIRDHVIEFNDSAASSVHNTTPIAPVNEKNPESK